MLTFREDENFHGIILLGSGPGDTGEGEGNARKGRSPDAVTSSVL